MAEHLLLLFLGLSSGLAVGGGFTAFLFALGIIPRLVDLTKTKSRLSLLEAALVMGAMSVCIMMISGWTFVNAVILVPFIGLFSGMFVGMLAGALTEVLKIIPLIARRLNSHTRLQAIIMAIITGKIAGSLFYWLIYLPYLKGE
ncbi:stage V sporulation protein AB [Jeotgalibacillus aurantiacus]|uniref:stage V sporulation protein AB n=1 Tax=Jeotgalibacillus aurantiacus TaxID=2763266 RepID=UPI001D0B2FDA|nr:stage V sporulation protein AB [Jeotgalibacillus aurantiacus]